MDSTEITPVVVDRATTRMNRARQGGHATTARYDATLGTIVVDLSTGLQVSFRAELAEGLASATSADLADIEITPSGLGLHWPRLDADLHLPSLLEGALGTKRWMAAALGASGGRARSAAKTAAAQENGKRGGRPPKAA